MNIKKIATLEFSKSSFSSKITKTVANSLNPKESMSIKNITIPNLLKKTVQNIGSSCQTCLHLQHGSMSDPDPHEYSLRHSRAASFASGLKITVSSEWQLRMRRCGSGCS
ncbi:hypothetical protein AGMMS50233_01740 [Endomicrobiia bacterium]|nr:hypothetical protein AGMMS50233_01740 [Endomicrobiia bacterium]